MLEFVRSSDLAYIVMSCILTEAREIMWLTKQKYEGKALLLSTKNIKLCPRGGSPYLQEAFQETIVG